MRIVGGMRGQDEQHDRHDCQKLPVA
jgi:hypothetical protein